MIEYAFNNDDDNDNNSNNNNDDDLPVDSPHKGAIMLSFDVTFVESKNTSSFWDAMPLTYHHYDVIYLCSTVISVFLKAVMNKLVHICPSVFKILCKMQLAVMFW